MAPSSLTTCCAHCRTVFRVTTGQLQAHGGQVRCGRCLQVFDALAALATEPAALETERGLAPAPAATPAVKALATAEPVAAPSAPVEAEPEPEPEPEPQASVAALEELLPEPQPAVAEDPALVEATAAEVVTADAGSGVEPTPPVETVDTDNPFVQSPADEQAVPPRRRLLAVASVTLAVVLAAQAVFFYRSEIAARHPLARQWLNTACAEAGCTVALPQRPQSIVIEASDLQVADPASPNRIQLTATLRNHAGHDVGYPALDLVLTNVNDHTLARRIFLPQEYLGGGRDVRVGIAANAEMTVRLALETGNLGAAGFRLAVLPAPPH